MLKAGAAHHAEGGGTKSNRAKGGVQVDGRFHGRNGFRVMGVMGVSVQLLDIVYGYDEGMGMARSIRIQSAGAYYHVMARGNRREDIFHDDDDRRFFLHTLSQACVNKVSVALCMHA